MPPAEPQPREHRSESNNPNEVTPGVLDVDVSTGVPGVVFTAGPEKAGPITGALTVVDNGCVPSEEHTPEPGTTSRVMPLSINKQRKSTGVCVLPLSDDQPMDMKDAPVPLPLSAAGGHELPLQAHAEEKDTAQQSEKQPLQPVEKPVDQLHLMRLRHKKDKQLQEQALLAMLNRFPGPVGSINQVKAQPALLLAHAVQIP